MLLKIWSKAPEIESVYLMASENYSFVRSSYYRMRRAELREAVGLPATVDSPALDDPEAPSAPAPAPATAAPRSGKQTTATASSAKKPAKPVPAAEPEAREEAETARAPAPARRAGAGLSPAAQAIVRRRRFVVGP